MKIKSVYATNFGSYRDTEFDFSDEGLTLISGPAGAGKSTLCDMVPWAIYGVTAKDGAADEVIAWNADGPTKVILTAYIKDVFYRITRVRGKGANDLYYSLDQGPAIRGKDLKDTQKLINDLIGCNADTFLAAAYFHEFSKTASFFTADAKTRRHITEQIVDLSLPKNLAIQTSEYKKLLKDELQKTKTDLERNRYQLGVMAGTLRTAISDYDNWQTRQASKIVQERLLSENFQTARQDNLEDMIMKHTRRTAEIEIDLKELTNSILPDSHFEAIKRRIDIRKENCTDSTCPTCGATQNNTNKLMVREQEYALASELQSNEQRKIQIVRNTNMLTQYTKAFQESLDKERARLNPHQDNLDALAVELNPYTDRVSRAKEDVASLDQLLNEGQIEADKLSIHLADAETLLTINEQFRGALIQQCISDVETQTNKLLEEHFDAEIRVKFSTEEADKILVDITKDGNQCSYSQLSKGQRRLLRLCYGVSVMRAVQNHNHVEFNIAFIDEAFDGCDDVLKVKGFGLLQVLSSKYESLFVVEHSEVLKSMFNNGYEVSLVGGKSKIEAI